MYTWNMKKNQLYPTNLTDHQWDCIKELIPAAKPGGHPRMLDMRRIWVDGTYRDHLLEWVILHCRFRLQRVLRRDDQKGFVILPRRWVVERTFA